MAEANTEGADRSACTPCRGTGRLLSSLGGTAHEVACPWCGGTGQFQPGRDAQQAPAETSAGA
jgi:DnaJ-class molecular chaperone